VAANYSPTLGALPSFLFAVKKLLNTILLDVLKVFNQAHPEESFVAPVEMTEPFAGEILAFIAVLYLSIQKQLASLFEEGAHLASRSTTDAVRHSDSLTLYCIVESEVSTAYSTVHSTRSN